MTASTDSAAFRRLAPTPPRSAPAHAARRPFLRRPTNTSRPGTPSHAPGEAPTITVTEADLKRCGNDLNLLMQCQVEHEMEAKRSVDGKGKSEEQVDYKTAFSRRCKQEPFFKDNLERIGNPELAREHTDSDLTLNQVLPTASWHVGDLRTTERRQSRQRGPAAGAAAAAVRAVAERGSRLRQWAGRSSAAGGGSRHDLSTSSTSSSSHRSPRPHPTQLLEDADLDMDMPIHSMPADIFRRPATVPEVDEEEFTSSPSHAAWVSLDSATGDLHLYTKSVASRLESAYSHNKASIPLAGLGEEYAHAIVHFGNEAKGEQPWQTAPGGVHDDVRRIILPAGATSVRLRVAKGPQAWIIVDDSDGVATEGRSLEFMHWEVPAAEPGRK